MVIFTINVKSDVIQRIECDINGPSHAKRKWHADLINIKMKPVAGKLRTARTNLNLIGIAGESVRTAFRHRPALAALAEQNDIERAMIFSDGLSVASLPFVVRRENTADKNDDR